MKGYTDDELRRNTWVIHMSAAALVFADNGGGNSSAGPSDARASTRAPALRRWPRARFE